MTKQLLSWRLMLFKTDRGQDYSSPIADLIAQKYRGTLISEILTMPKKKPIFFAEAVRLSRTKAGEAFFDGKIGKEPGENLWFQYNFIQFISESGYHIELTGDEFDSPLTLSKTF